MFSFAAGGDRQILMPPKFAADIKPDVMYSLATLAPGRASIVDLAFDLGTTLPRNSAVFCLSLSAPPRLREALEILREQGMDVRWYCARREAFEQKQTRGRNDGAAKSTRNGNLLAAELRPGMRLEHALEYGAVS
jgi:hypothetical protein